MEVSLVEWAISSLRFASELLRHFLDGPERKLRKQKLELEIRDLIRRESTQTDSDQMQAMIASVVADVRTLAASVPGVSVEQSRLHGPTLVRDQTFSSATDSLARLDQAVAERRAALGHTISPAGSPGLIAVPAPIGLGPDSATAEELVEWAEQEPLPTPPPSPPHPSSRLERLNKRVSDRRNEVK